MIELNLCLVRHGETDWNAAGRIQGQIDIPLNERGLSQAEALAEALLETRFDAIISSDLSRASVTARAVADRQGLAIETWPSLRERSYGPYEGMTGAEFVGQDPESFRRFRARDPDFDLAGGESLRTLQERARKNLDEFIARFSGKTILVVSHGGVIDSIHRLIHEEPLHLPRTFPVENCAIHWLTYGTQGWSVVRWGDTSHLTLTRDELPDA